MIRKFTLSCCSSLSTSSGVLALAMANYNRPTIRTETFRTIIHSIRTLICWICLAESCSCAVFVCVCPGTTTLPDSFASASTISLPVIDLNRMSASLRSLIGIRVSAQRREMKIFNTSPSALSFGSKDFQLRNRMNHVHPVVLTRCN